MISVLNWMLVFFSSTFYLTLNVFCNIFIYSGTKFSRYFPNKLFSTSFKIVYHNTTVIYIWYWVFSFWCKHRTRNENHHSMIWFVICFLCYVPYVSFLIKFITIRTSSLLHYWCSVCAYYVVLALWCHYDVIFPIFNVSSYSSRRQ